MPTDFSGPRVVVDADALARVGVALADATRRRLLLTLLDGPAFPADLAERLELTRGNVSNHLSCLRGCGLVTTTPVGRRVRYELADPRLAVALAELASLVLLVSHDECPPDSDCCDSDESADEGTAP
ncbi:transcriptional regulator [Planotetraspora thailandica]|uniref:Transcriptional regulator n=1 Tax=Planotetraspora thailandica TaxID=487172 RepID=A0A8J4DDK6_9ACTN|nr:helix-turn-helix domain-containing protein [Planotetraspora thailandica]GII58603.1 transcriptional regulator [Planotetraspora thailandica]